jgi:hypothetical protein
MQSNVAQYSRKRKNIILTKGVESNEVFARSTRYTTASTCYTIRKLIRQKQAYEKVKCICKNKRICLQRAAYGTQKTYDS